MKEITRREFLTVAGRGVVGVAAGFWILPETGPFPDRCRQKLPVFTITGEINDGAALPDIRVAGKPVSRSWMNTELPNFSPDFSGGETGVSATERVVGKLLTDKAYLRQENDKYVLTHLLRSDVGVVKRLYRRWRLAGQPSVLSLDEFRLLLSSASPAAGSIWTEIENPKVNIPSAEGKTLQPVDSAKDWSGGMGRVEVVSSIMPIVGIGTDVRQKNPDGTYSGYAGIAIPLGISWQEVENFCPPGVDIWTYDSTRDEYSKIAIWK